jgi:hypothetical protein
MFFNLRSFYRDQNFLLLTIAGLIVVLEIWIVLEGIAVFTGRKKPQQAAA